MSLPVRTITDDREELVLKKEIGFKAWYFPKKYAWQPLSSRGKN